MGVLVFLNPVSTTVLDKFARSTTDRRSWSCIKKNSSVCWQSNIGRHEITSGKIPCGSKRLVMNNAAAAGAGSMEDLSSNDDQNKSTKDDIQAVVKTYTSDDDDDDNDGGGIGIVKFLRGKRLFITGATGFLAKVLLEKILRTMPDVGKIYVLIKARNKEDAMNRLKNEIINEELFKCLQRIHGKSYETFMVSKLIPVVGNVCESNIGMEEDIAELVAGEVDVIINSAANTTFDERYDVALNINTRGPSRLMSFAKRCKTLKLFLQLSTAYVNGERQGRILEKGFSIGDCIAREKTTIITSKPLLLLTSLPVLDVEGEIKLAFESKQTFQDHQVVQRMKELGLERARMHGWQDTYVFTKAMGEMLIDDQRGEIPVVVIRPSVIESTCSEPFPGWMEGNRMMDPIVLYYGKGQLTGFLADPNGVLDVVPADMVVNAILAAMAKHGASASRKPEIKIYHVASSVVNPLMFQDLVKFFYEHFSSFPYMDSKGRPIHVPRMKLFTSMDDFSSHIWRDTIQRSEQLVAAAASNEKLSRKLEIASKKSVEQVKYLANIYEPYTFYGGRFDNTNTEKLMEELSEEEKKSFGFDVRSIDWQHYISKIHIPGLRKHVMKGRGMP
ncbi:fatty acyl-CoA reductase 2, chloroplastic-like [Telopea speciosissima]|uniref:fatty acyl-CoA reductase 2, chloroplastic-like n=1 Tax=Telopea speciosissima TaxID=54955 RepID=UPI001CC479B5|nr:fatty acyl-CoA reductase 2, chloroplastic-like [Telopea speciosissima]